MKQYDSISIVQMSLLIITAVGLKNHVTVIPHLLAEAKRDAWLSIIIAFVFTSIWSLLLLYVHKSTGTENVFNWLGQHCGKWVKWLFALPTSLIFVLSAAETIKEMVAWARVTFLSLTPIFYTIVLFVLLCMVLVLTSLQTMAIVNTLVLSAILIFGYFVAFANMPNKDFTLLLPFLEHGIEPVIRGSIYPLSGHIEIIALLFLQHKIHNKLTFKSFVINLLLLSYLTGGPLIGAIVEFGPLEAVRTRFPAYEEWRLVSLGRFIEHVDFLSLYQWITGAFIRVTFLFYLAVEVLGMKKRRQQRFVVLLVALIVIVLNLIPVSDSLVHDLIRDYTMPVHFWYFFSLSLLLSLIAFVKKRTKRRDSHVQAKKTHPVQSE